MDDHRFDAWTRAWAGALDRRTLVRRSAAVGALIAGLSAVHPSSAARRGGSGGMTSICSPDGSGGYYRNSVPTVLLATHLAGGAIISDCCTHAECGPTNSCQTAVCNFTAGACNVTYNDGASCPRSGCAPGVCSAGACANPTPYTCGGDGVCNICTYDACAHTCNCWVRPCYTDDYQCMDAYCDTGSGGCVNEPLNEGGYCNTNGVDGTCVMGYCTEA